MSRPFWDGPRKAITFFLGGEGGPEFRETLVYLVSEIQGDTVAQEGLRGDA